MSTVRLRLWVPALFALTFSGAVAAADALHQVEGLALLQKIADAARKLNYAGTFVYRHGDQVETSRIAHFVEGENEHEKLETMDGPRREIIRNNDEILCYYPDAKIIRSDKRMARRNFPALLPEQLSALTENYVIRKGATERIGGFDAQALILEPKDAKRYGHKFWADVNSGLLLKASLIGEGHTVVEQISFTQVVIGAAVTRQMVKPSFTVRFPEWRLDRFATNPISEVESGWTVRSIPAGFRKILEMRRSKQGNSVLVTHLVYSDGLAAVSIFIEPALTRGTVDEGPFQHGAINIFIRAINDQIVTVLGEAPAVTVMQIAHSVAPRGQ